MIIPKFNRTQKFLYEVDELRAISGYMLGASGVQIPENNLDNLHSIVEDGAIEITNVTTGLVVLLSIGIGFLKGTIAVVVILVKGHTFPTNVKVRRVDEMALVLTTLFLLSKLGCDPLALVSKFTSVEESTGVLETMFVEDFFLMGVFPDEGICSVNLIFLLLFFGVTTISLVPNSTIQTILLGLPEDIYAVVDKEYDLMAATADLDEIEEVNANCILMANLQQASTSDEQYTELLEPIPKSHQVPQNDIDVISKDTSMEQGGETVEQHPANFEETHALYES
nr:hypothetical protein [Tanacetum cinerariifolium]